MKTTITKCWERLKTLLHCGGLSAQIAGSLTRVDAMPTVDDRSAEEILGYDEHGLPR